MSKSQIGEFADILYNYEFASIKDKKRYYCPFLTNVPSECPAYWNPFLRIYFYHKKHINYINVFYNAGFPPIRFWSTFDKSPKHKYQRADTRIFWGYCCEDYYNLLNAFFDKNFKYNMQEQQEQFENWIFKTF